MEIVWVRARGIDTCAAGYARKTGKLTDFLPQYDKYGGSAIYRLLTYSDEVIVFSDGILRGIKYVIDQCIKQNKKIIVYIFKTIAL